MVLFNQRFLLALTSLGHRSISILVGTKSTAQPTEWTIVIDESKGLAFQLLKRMYDHVAPRIVCL